VLHGIERDRVSEVPSYVVAKGFQFRLLLFEKPVGRHYTTSVAMMSRELSAPPDYGMLT
jgi:hypothetical protein